MLIRGDRLRGAGRATPHQIFWLLFSILLLLLLLLLSYYYYILLAIPALVTASWLALVAAINSSSSY